MADRADLYTEVTNRILAELEAGSLPWLKPWTGGNAAIATSMPSNGLTGRAYSGVNVILLWMAGAGYQTARWVTFKQALALGGAVRKGEKGTTIVFADRFIPKAEAARAARDGDTARAVPFLKRYTVFNVAQCDGLPDDLHSAPAAIPADAGNAQIAELVQRSGAVVRIGGDNAFFAPGPDVIGMPPVAAFTTEDDYFATLLHELTHWTGHASRLARPMKGAFGSKDYALEELVAEMGSAFACAALGIVPQVRHADYLASWIKVLKEDNRAIVRAASQASKAADLLLSYVTADTGAEASDQEALAEAA